MDDTIEEPPPESAAQAAQKQAGQPPLVSFDEDPAYLLFHYPTTAAKEDRVVFSEGGLLAEVNIMFMNISIENKRKLRTSGRLRATPSPPAA